MVDKKIIHEQYQEAVQNGRPAEMRVAGIDRGGFDYNGLYHFVGSRSVGRRAVSINDTIKYHGAK